MFVWFLDLIYFYTNNPKMKHLYLFLFFLLVSCSVFAVGPITGSTNICVGSISTLSDTSAGGMWTSSNIAIATIGTSGIVTGVGVGTSIITYSVGTSFSTIMVTISTPRSAGTILGLPTLCLGTDIVMSETTTGGVWSSSNAGAATINSATGFVTGVANGTTIITYAVTGCSTTYATHNLIVAVSPAIISGLSSGCIGFVRTLFDSTLGGTWSSSNSLIASVGSSTGLLSGVSIGSATISYILPSGCYSATTTNVSPVLSPIAGFNTVCLGNHTRLTDSVSGGTWSSSNPSIAYMYTDGNYTGLIIGTATITYATNAGCFVTTNVRVSPTPGPITGAMPICAGANITLADTMAGGSWSSSDISVATIVPSSGIVTGVSSGTAIITYSMGGACNVVKTMTINTTPSGIITGPARVCTVASISLSETVPGGTWSSSSTNATISITGNVTGITAGTTIVSYTVIGICGAGYATKVIGINSSISSGTIGVPANICKGTTATLTETQFGGTWTSSSLAIAVINSSSGALTGISAGTAIISYTNGCSAAPATIIVNILPLPTFSGPVIVCVGNNLTLSASPAGGNWISSDTSVITIGSTTGIAHGVVVGGSSITYTTIQGCKNTEMVYSNTYPSAGSIYTPSVICTGNRYTLTETVSGGSWSSNNSSIATIGTVSGNINGISAGTTIITYIVTGCTVVTATTVVTVNPLPVITGRTFVCQGSSITLAATPGGGIWHSSVTSFASIDSVTGVAFGAGMGNSVINYTSPIGCVGMETLTVGGLPNPGTITGPPVIYLGLDFFMHDLQSGGIWSSSDVSIASIGSTGLIRGVSIGTVTVSYTVTNPCGSSTTTKTVIVELTNGVNPIALENSGTFQIFPNPVADILTIHWASQFKGPAGVTITDMLGRGVYESKFLMDAEDGDREFGLIGLPDGLYMVTIKTDNTSYTTKMVKMKR